MQTKSTLRISHVDPDAPARVRAISRKPSQSSAWPETVLMLAGAFAGGAALWIWQAGTAPAGSAATALAAAGAWAIVRAIALRKRAEGGETA